MQGTICLSFLCSQLWTWCSKFLPWLPLSVVDGSLELWVRMNFPWVTFCQDIFIIATETKLGKLPFPLWSSGRGGIKNNPSLCSRLFCCMSPTTSHLRDDVFWGQPLYFQYQTYLKLYSSLFNCLPWTRALLDAGVTAIPDSEERWGEAAHG